jgi:PEP-CTERM motif
MKWLATSVMLLLFVSTASAAPITFELLPGNGAIDGEAGATIGWGYTVTNQSEFWLELTNVDADPFEHAIADASLFDYAIIAPGDTHTVIYNAATLEGLYQLTWDALAPIGFTNSGTFVLSANYWDADPFQAGAAIVSAAPTQSAAYSATVSTVPEPGTLLLMGAGAGIGALVRRRRRSSM